VKNGQQTRKRATGKVRRLDREQLWQYALRLLAARAYSEGELKQRLLRRAQAPSDAEQVLCALKERRLLDDRRFAEAFAISRLESEGFGWRRTLAELRRRKVDRQLAQEVVEATYQQVDEVQLIEDYLKRKYRQGDLAARLQEPRELASVYRRLRRAGFGSGNIIRVLRQYSELADELEGLEETERGETGQTDMLEA